MGLESTLGGSHQGQMIILQVYWYLLLLGTGPVVLFLCVIDGKGANSVLCASGLLGVTVMFCSCRAKEARLLLSHLSL